MLLILVMAHHFFNYNFSTRTTIEITNHLQIKAEDILAYVQELPEKCDTNKRIN